MRYVIFGAGAIGGLVGARLHQSGHDVMLVARGAHYEKIAADGLTFATPTERVTLAVPVVASVAEAGLRDGDVVLLCTKSQQSWDALLSIRDAAADATDNAVPIVCLQNGVANERLALRLFPEVYGALVMVPAEHLEPGYIVGYLGKLSGRIDVGIYPSGVDGRAQELSAALAAARFESEALVDVMRHKYAKLVSNLNNGVQAVCGIADPEGNSELGKLLAAEGRAVLTAAGIPHTVEDVANIAGRWERMGIGEVDGHGHQGGSTWQSVTRGTGNVETDYLNGEIVLLGRTLGIPTPYNALVQLLTRVTVTGGHEPGWRSARELIVEADGRTRTVSD
jgi:2-dehydropantoate 2-reductase